MTLFNVAYTSKYDSNLISLGQLRKSGISYYDYFDSMILKQGKSKIELVLRYRNLFILKTESENKVMLMREWGCPTYLLSSSLQIQLWHCRFSHASNVKVVQVSKVIDRINLRKKSGFINKFYSSDSESNNNLDINANVLTSINKVKKHNSKDAKELCKTYIENKHTRIIKSRKMTSTIKKLQEVYINLWGPYKLVSILSKNYIGLLLNEFTYKLWILFLKSKDEFFNAFKLWLLRVEVCGSRLDCLWTDDGKEFISTTFQNFCQKWGIKIGYATPYIYKENGIAKQY